MSNQAFNYRINKKINLTNVITSSNQVIDYLYLSKIIQNLNTKERIVSITTNEQIINESILSKPIIINEIVKYIFKLINLGKDAHKYIFDFFNSHNIKSHEIYNWLLNNRNDLDSIFLLGYFNYRN